MTSWIRCLTRAGGGCNALRCVSDGGYWWRWNTWLFYSPVNYDMQTTSDSNSCSAPLQYSADTAGISISKFTDYALNNESSVLNRGLAVWSFLITFPTDNPGSHALPIPWRALSLRFNFAHTSIYSILVNRILYCVVQCKVLPVYGQWLISP